MKYALLVAYDGTAYGGWQMQKNAVSVQSRLQEAAFAVTGSSVAVIGSGRTDAGVHALGQVCHFSAESSVPPEKMADALNAHLPEDISVLASASAPADFDASRSAKRKTYCYKMYCSPRPNPLKDRYSVRVKQDVDIQKLQHICKVFAGEHDFKAYCASGSTAKTTVREVYFVTAKQSGADIEIRVCGNGFLYNMVRTIAGTMLFYALGRITEADIVRSLESGDRSLVGKTMPAKGLVLESVDYGFDLFGV